MDAADRAALLGLSHSVRHFFRHATIVRERDRPTHSCVLLSGLTIRHKLVSSGARQIVGIQVAGDMIDLQNSMFEIADHSIQTLTTAEVALVPRQALRDLAASRPSVGTAMWFDTLLDASIAREWIANVGRRDARTRLAHLLCEMAVRFEMAGIGRQSCYELPMSQEQIADALGLTSVHVNRMLKALEGDGLIVRTRRSVTIADWAQLIRAGDFDSTYLHLEQRSPGSIQ
ncbi:Crp/Fnr family transcriptional regulator [Sphingosinicella sp. CPCC 101087]|uniref:Crp/Fnr family transcriptional regulator n=1 Tax=Sphingosinicella sp. CPCC 101087 TaxID=2497754 RepID=UPI001FB11AE0|nr:Crp/Fnr family transcriptional regulator [Sphingosinicella sp. CPCC 101087]